jgi:hypothetical protein
VVRLPLRNLSLALCLIVTTFQIFFPRSAENEYAAQQARSFQKQSQVQMRNRRQYELEDMRSSQHYLTNELPTKTYDSDYDDLERAASPSAKADLRQAQAVHIAKFAPNRRRSNGDITRGAVHVEALTENNLAKHDVAMGKNPYAHNFTSPIRSCYLLHFALLMI